MSRAMSSYVWTEMAFHMTCDDGNGGQKDKKFARIGNVVCANDENLVIRIERSCCR